MPGHQTLVGVRRIATPVMRRLFVGQFLSALGNGLTLSLIVVYLHTVRDLPLTSATAVLAWQALLGLALSPAAGTLVDRWGPRPVLLGAILVQASGILWLGHVTTLPHAVMAMSVIAAGGAGIWGPHTALVARLVPQADRTTAFGLGFMLLNLGLGLGGLIGATIIDLDDPSTFTTLYTLDATAFLAYFIAVLSVGNVGAAPVLAPGDASTAESPTGLGVTDPAGAAQPSTSPEPPGQVGQGGWAEVLRDRALLRFAAAGFLMLTFGYGSIDAGVSLFITDLAELEEHFIGIVFAFNTAVIVVMQLFVISLVNGRSRSRVLASVGILWAISWLLFGSALGRPEWAAVLLLVLGISVFAIGETMWSPVAPALLNDLAPEHLRGRYNSFQSIMWGISGAMGPLLTGMLLSGGGGHLWTTSLAAGCGAAALIASRLRRHLTEEQDGRTAPVPVAVASA